MTAWHAPATYVRQAFNDLFAILKDLEKVALKSDRHVQLRPGVAIIMYSDDGSRWRLTLDKDGAWQREGPL
jgi:hypothetical protein